MTENTVASKPQSAPVKKTPAARKPAAARSSTARKAVTAKPATTRTTTRKTATAAKPGGTAVRRTSSASRPVTVKTALPKPAAVSPAKHGKKHKKEKKAAGKSKVIRDSFTMPEADYVKLAELKQVCQKAGLHVKKSELLRAGLLALSKMSMAQLERAIVQLVPIKTGRPKKS